jgi:hypothetical protein
VEYVIFVDSKSISIYETINQIKIIDLEFGINNREISNVLKGKKVYIIHDILVDQEYFIQKVPDSLNILDKIRLKRSTISEIKSKFKRVIQIDEDLLMSISIQNNLRFSNVISFLKKSGAILGGIFLSSFIERDIINKLEAIESAAETWSLWILEVDNKKSKHLLMKGRDLFLQRGLYESIDNEVFREFIIKNDSDETIKFAIQDIFPLFENDINVEKIDINCIFRDKYERDDISYEDIEKIINLKFDNYRELLASFVSKNNNKVNLMDRTSYFKYLIKNKILQIGIAIFVLCSSSIEWNSYRLHCEIKKNEKVIAEYKKEIHELNKKTKIKKLDIKSINKIIMMKQNDIDYLESLLVKIINLMDTDDFAENLEIKFENNQCIIAMKIAAQNISNLRKYIFRGKNTNIKHQDKYFTLETKVER